MKFTKYISQHQLFTTAQLLEASDSPAAAEEQLRLAVKSNSVERVRRGLYASQSGRYQGVTPDSFAVVTACDPDAVICYHSALEAYGVAHNISFDCAFRSARVLDALHDRLCDGPYRIGCRLPSTDSVGWVKQWKLILPESIEEVSSWITLA